MMPTRQYASDDPLAQGIAWLSDPQNWWGDGSIMQRIGEHLGFTVLAVFLAALGAVPLGLYVGHTGHGRVVVVALGGMLRALPTLGLMTLLALLMGLGLLPPVLALVLLALPTILSACAAGVSTVNPAIVDAARGLGMTGWQILFQVEIPNGLAVILGGLRGCVLQVVATVAVVAYLPQGGLGRFLVDGLKTKDYGSVFGGAVVIAVLALVLDGLLALLSRYAVSPGVRGRTHDRRSAPETGLAEPSVVGSDQSVLTSGG
ncbi:ABC transporter permease [Psychromicrobium xiongbiense]|uniref:ABC transporter permease n=1 Tax=Psychromicrobium xiongbiense TaxID=3051184 RepID=UPI0025565414|nr:ABC transporter permease subunit [Psychromicrobium sp. YIM S02556]